MSNDDQPGMTRRTWLAAGGIALLAGTTRAGTAHARDQRTVRLSLNENAFGPSPKVAEAISRHLHGVERYVDQTEADALIDQIAASEQIRSEQVILGEVLEPLGLHLARRHGNRGTIIYSAPGYTALVDGSAPLGGTGIAVPLNARLENDLPALASKVDGGTIAVNLVNPHNPSGTVNDAAAFDGFIREVSGRTLVVVDEAYLEYDDFQSRSAVRLARAGANVLVFRTFAKIYGLAGLAIGYAIAPSPLAAELRSAGIGAPHSLNRLALVAAAAALEDQAYIREIRSRTVAERSRVIEALDRIGLEHSDSRANFVFFRSPRVEAARDGFRAAGIEIGRPFPPLDDWIRVTIGQPRDTDAVLGVLNRL